MAESMKTNFDVSEDDDSFLETDACPIPLPAPAPQALPSPEPQNNERPKIVKKKQRKKKSFDGFDNCFFKNGGFAGMFNGTNNMSHKGQTYYSHIENANNVHIGPNISITQQAKPKKEPKQNKSSEWELPKHYFACTRPVTEDMIRDVSPFIGYSWRSLGRELGFCKAEMDTVEYDKVRMGLEEVVILLLEKWVEQNGKRATIGKLIEAFWKTDCRETEPKFEAWLKPTEAET